MVMWCLNLLLLDYPLKLSTYLHDTLVPVKPSKGACNVDI